MEYKIYYVSFKIKIILNPNLYYGKEMWIYLMFSIIWKLF